MRLKCNLQTFPFLFFRVFFSMIAEATTWQGQPVAWPARSISVRLQRYVTTSFVSSPLTWFWSKIYMSSLGRLRPHFWPKGLTKYQVKFKIVLTRFRFRALFKCSNSQENATFQEQTLLITFCVVFIFQFFVKCFFTLKRVLKIRLTHLFDKGRELCVIKL